MAGGLGIDVYYVDQINDTVFENANSGADTVKTTANNYILPANVENLSLYAGASTGTGNALANSLNGRLGLYNDTLSGLDGNDFLNGWGGNDILSGGNGNDSLLGDVGSDQLTGGSNADLFSYNTVSDSISGARDVITDFTPNVDKVDLSIVDANTSLAGNQAFLTSQISYISGIATLDIIGSSLDMQIQFTGTPTINWTDIIL